MHVYIYCRLPISSTEEYSDSNRSVGYYHSDSVTYYGTTATAGLGGKNLNYTYTGKLGGEEFRIVCKKYIYIILLLLRPWL